MTIKDFAGVSGSRVAYYAARELQSYQHALIVVSSGKAAERLQEDLSFFAPSVPSYILPEEEDLQILYEARDMGQTVRRVRGMHALLSEEPAVVIAPVSSVLRPVESPERFKKSILSIELGGEYEPNLIREHLIRSGYEFSPTCESAGEFSMRGDILDVFSPNNDQPVRIEFFDTEVDSIRFYDPVSQRSGENADHVVLCQALEFMPTDEEIRTALDRILQEYDSRIALLEAERDRDQTEDGRISRLRELRGRLEEQFLYHTNQQIYGDYLSYFDEPAASLWHYLRDGAVMVVDPKRVEDSIPEYLQDRDYRSVYRDAADCVLFTPFPEAVPGAEKLDELVNVRSHSVASFNGQLSIFAEEVRSRIRSGYEIHLVSSTEERSERIREYLEDEGIRGRVRFETGSLSTGMLLEDEKLFYVTESDLFPDSRKKPLRKKRKSRTQIDFSDLNTGDYVVHETHGIGRFEGIRTLTADGEVKDYLKIHYAGTDVLYIPTEQLDIVQKYIGNEGNAPKLSKLSGGEWRRTRERARKSVMAIAEDLVRLYAEREAAEGYAFGQDTVWQKEFEDAFPYTETEDQLRSIEEIKQDMQDRRPMDRLLCGDVGYGKTEVAARAIFKCISEGKQAVMLAPTTLLVNQHYHTMLERFENFPFTIEMLSRFRSDAEQEEILRRLKRGTVDLIIGTHRLLSKDVAFKDLGLLVIDEEQRFGVKHKEQIKMLRKNIDVLTLSATPIPRTLSMSLTGIKNISMIEEPPENRYPVQTFVTPEDEELLQTVIRRELARNGQIFVIYNRIQGIYSVAEELRELVPEAAVAVGHGRMDETRLENVMLDFVEGRTDILVATTIIENGIDIPNANTMIILNADKLGLAQLYQLRGRVGRSDVMAYAYLMYRPDQVLSAIARKRLTAIREFTEFGAGFKLAMRDLELRGAGNVLGEAQHGHIEGIGYELYCKEIDRAVRMLSGEEVTETRAEITMEIDTPARIPASYIEDETLRLQAYKKIAQIDGADDAEDVTNELIDRYGDLPAVTMDLIRVAELRCSAERLGVSEILGRGPRAQISFYEKNRADAFALVMAKQAMGDRLVISGGTVPRLSLYTGGTDVPEKLVRLMRAMLTPRN
ncbi:MAG: transcription-repair coupling factor [Mogibacterium sp.]|nr:transcription-repair coupling factor [Mogibacterium sp.]